MAVVSLKRQTSAFSVAKVSCYDFTNDSGCVVCEVFYTAIFVTVPLLGVHYLGTWTNLNIVYFCSGYFYF